MELFVSMLKGRWLALFELVGVVLGLVIVGMLLVYSWDHAMRAFYLGDSTIDAQIPLWPSKIIVPISLGMLFVRLLVSLWAYMRVILDPSKTLIGVAAGDRRRGAGVARGGRGRRIRARPRADAGRTAGGRR